MEKNKHMIGKEKPPQNTPQLWKIRPSGDEKNTKNTKKNINRYLTSTNRTIKLKTNPKKPNI